jgi:hypothetical protein
MSTGHLKYEKKGEAELYKVLGEGDTPKLLARKYLIDTTHDWPYAGGNSVDGHTVYFDRTFYREIMDGIIKVRGMSPRDIISRVCDHEHSEWSIMVGDNPVDSYPPAHALATTYEHRDIKNPERYEECLKPGLKRCIKRFIALGTKANPPRDVWCGPVLDDPDDDDREILRILRAKGVHDAFKVSKISVHYGTGDTECKDCKMFGDGKQKTGVMRQCELVSGLVRADRWCDKWVALKGNGHG